MSEPLLSAATLILLAGVPAALMLAALAQPWLQRGRPARAWILSGLSLVGLLAGAGLSLALLENQWGFLVALPLLPWAGAIGAFLGHGVGRLVLGVRSQAEQTPRREPRLARGASL